MTTFGAILVLLGFAIVMQAVGKEAVGIRVIRTYDGLLLGGPLASARRLCQFLNYPVVLPRLIADELRRQGQTFADKITSAVVIRADTEPVPPYTQG